MGNLFGKIGLIVIFAFALAMLTLACYLLVTAPNNVPGLIFLAITGLVMMIISGYWIYLDWKVPNVKA